MLTGGVPGAAPWRNFDGLRRGRESGASRRPRQRLADATARGAVERHLATWPPDTGHELAG